MAHTNASGAAGDRDERRRWHRLSNAEISGLDRQMMERCLALAVRSGEEGEYPYGVIVCHAGEVLAESINRVAHEHDVTRHAEVVAISTAQHSLGKISLEDCVLYVSAEPCVYCCYAIRESRIGRVVYALLSPHMGGVSKWRVLTDEDLSRTIPEVFDPPPEIIAGFMAKEVERALLKWNPLVWGLVMRRGLFVAPASAVIRPRDPTVDPRRGLARRLLGFLRRTVFDRFGRG